MLNCCGPSDKKPINKPIVKPSVKPDDKPGRKRNINPDIKPDIKPKVKPKVKPDHDPRIDPYKNPRNLDPKSDPKLDPMPDQKPDPKRKIKPGAPLKLPNAVTAKLHKFGEQGSGFRTKGEPQDFYALRDECLANGTLFEDPEFFANVSTLYFSQKSEDEIEWRRPMEIVNNPQFFVEGHSRFDVVQGELGDCWLLSALGNLTLNHQLFFQVVPNDQSFTDKYAGIFHFRFWQYGRWVDVPIDDRLPTYEGQLIYLHSTEINEFWSPLLEKAYAKLHGSYEAIKGGSGIEAMEDFTGGVGEIYKMSESPPHLFKILQKAYERSSLMDASIQSEELEATTKEGLITRHAYSITKIATIDLKSVKEIQLIRLRNPWGNDAEWNGAWCDGAPEWSLISSAEKKKLGLTFDYDGEFWMTFEDFKTHFTEIEICNLNPDSLSQEQLLEEHKKKWEISVFEGEWVRGITAGGCRNFLNTFCHNQQYLITLTDVDENDDEAKCTLIVGLMQKNRRKLRKQTKQLWLYVGFAIYYLTYPDLAPRPLDTIFFNYNQAIAKSASFINLREVSCRFKLPSGTYCIIPSTFNPNEEAEFILRVISEKKNIMEENDIEVSYSPPVHSINVIPKPIAGFEDDIRETSEIYEVFLKVCGEDEEIDWMELKRVLDYALKIEPGNRGFSKDICRSMIAMLDEDRSGKLGFKEFKLLWIMFVQWKNIFDTYDKDRSGSFSGFELREALKSAGFNLNNHILSLMMHRFGNRHGEISFEDFILCAIKLRTMMELYKKKDLKETNSVTFTLDEWLQNTLYT